MYMGACPVQNLGISNDRKNWTFLASLEDADPVKPACIKSLSAGVCVILVFKDEHHKMYK